MSVIKESKLQDKTVMTTGFGKVISNQFKNAASELLHCYVLFCWNIYFLQRYSCCSPIVIKNILVTL